MNISICCEKCKGDIKVWDTPLQTCTNSSCECHKVNASTPSHHTWEMEFWKFATPNKFSKTSFWWKTENPDSTPELVKDFIAKVESDAIARTVQEILLIGLELEKTGKYDYEGKFYKKVSDIKDYAKAKGIIINDTTI